MPTTLHRDLRRDLEKTIRQARRVAETGARKALEQLAVHHYEPWPSLTPAQRSLRNRLRAHARQLGDRRDERRGTQAIGRLTAECAYEHWHRMLFARFLADADLLIEPETGVAISLDETQELARSRGADWLEFASDFAVRMLPQIFRKGDPVLGVTLPPETRSELEELLKTLPREVFLADDSLGWVYQFWQTDRKNEVNRSETKIGADELPAVTQLFTEDYMVLFLLHNTLGAWWAGKVLAARPDLASTAKTEDELRAACAVGDIDWANLRFVREGNGSWRPAAGTFDGWPKAAKDLTVLDPCMGSGHFLVLALPILATLRATEAGLSPTDAVQAVLRENLFGLEIDPRCTQIAAFNLALAAWHQVGYQPLPPLQLACSGLSISAREQEWLALAGKDARLRSGMERLYRLFEQAPTLGSLINPRALEGDLLVAEFRDLQPLLDQALAREATDESTHELAVTAQGVAKAAEILAGQFTLVATNVPYLGRGKQHDVLKEYCERVHPDAKADLATSFIERCRDFYRPNGTIALVTPQNWFFLGTYKRLRISLLREARWNFVARLGEKAFESSPGAFAALVSISRTTPSSIDTFFGVEASEESTPHGKALTLRNAVLTLLNQRAQQGNPDAAISLASIDSTRLLGRLAECFQGISTGDSARLTFNFWEIPSVSSTWRFFQHPPAATQVFAGREFIVNWRVLEAGFEAAAIRGGEAWDKVGVAIGQMRGLPATLYSGTLFSNSTPVVIPRRGEYLPAIWVFCSSKAFNEELRKLNPKVSVDNGYVSKVPFDLAHWQQIATEEFPKGLPKPHSDDLSQWLFAGHPRRAEQPLQVVVARLLGYRWPRQTGSSFPDCPALGPDGLEPHTDPDGIVCLVPLRGEQSAADRLRALLADALEDKWSLEIERQLIASAGSEATSLEDWLRDDFFAQHCALFHQRPFIWHVWDGRRDGFHVLVNYHRLAAPHGEGRRTLDKLLYTYLGDWIDQQRSAQKTGVEGADARLAAAQHLKTELEKILAGEPPYDILVRWKALHEQPVGWEPDLNDGVRINIRPFMTAQLLGARTTSTCILRIMPRIKWDKDRGKEPHRDRGDFPWFWGWDGKTHNFAGGTAFDGNRWNNLHYTTAFKRAARERRVRKQTATAP